MRIVNKPYMDWSSSFRKRLRSLTLRVYSDMLKAVAKKQCDSFVVFDDNDLIVGWAIYVMEPWYAAVPGDFSVYVRKAYRKKGIGKMLIKTAIEKYGSLRIHPWNDNSGKFFAKMIDEEKDALVVVRGDYYLK